MISAPTNGRASRFSRSARQPTARSERIERVGLVDGAGGAAQRLARKRGDERGADEEGGGVDGEDHGGRAQEEQRGAEGRPGDDAEGRDADARGVGGGEVSGADQPRQHGHDALRVGGAGGGAQRGEQRGEDYRRAGEGDEGECAHRGGAQDVGEDHDHATVVAVGEHAAERSQHDLRHDARRGRDRDPDRRAGALVHEREQRQVVQPVAGLGDDQAAEQDAQVALAQRDEERAGGIEHEITGVVGGTRAAERLWFRGRAGRAVWL